MMFQKIGNYLKKKYAGTDRKTVIVYIVLRVLVVLSLIRELTKGDLNNAVLCILSLVLFTLPHLVSSRFRITLPSALEIIIYLFIYAAEILGEINNFYMIIPFWDTILHTINGFLCAAIGFSLVDLLNQHSHRLNLSPLYLCIVSFCFSMTVGVCWEFIEFSADSLVRTDMQKDTWVHSISSVALNPEKKNKPVIIKGIKKTELYLEDGSVYTMDNGYLDIGLIDTMSDLFVNLVGAAVFSVFGYFYVTNRDKKSIVTNFIPRPMDQSSDPENA
ncbi:MAG: hypothetical protein SOI44_07335 [Lactimicrobium sp.]|uniref:hypothetical protein n=1 Tax=Lactimicrobium sp. TaxID=2563780 RepID=UPI002F358818